MEPEALSLNDLWEVIIRARKKIGIAAIAGALLVGGWAATRRPVWEASGLFTDAPKSGATVGSQMRTLLGLGTGGEGAAGALSLMTSRRLLEPVASQLGLQASLHPVGHHPPGPIKSAVRNIRIELLSAMRKKRLPLGTTPSPFRCREVSYHGEQPLHLSIAFTDHRHFDLRTPKGQLLGSGEVGQPVEGRTFRFLLDCPPGEYNLTLLPLDVALINLSSQLRINASSQSEQIIDVCCTHPDRFIAANIVNHLMLAYESYLRERDQRRSSEQLAYLRKRQDETVQELTRMMSQNAEQFSADDHPHQFLSLEDEVSFLVEHQREIEQRLAALQLEEEALARSDYTFGEASDLLASDVKRLYILTQQRDALDFSLHERGRPPVDPLAFRRHLNQVEKLHAQAAQVEALRSNPSLLNELGAIDPMLSFWAHTLSADLIAGTPQPAWKPSEGRFENYLESLHRARLMRAEIMESRLPYQPPTHTDFEGIDLETAHELYLAYTEKRDGVEQQQRELERMLEQLPEPGFDVSSLSAHLGDRVSQRVIEEAMEALAALRDSANHTSKERERLRLELARHKHFLASHLRQSREVLASQAEHLNEKLYALQESHLDILQQNISVLQAELRAQAGGRLETLGLERALLVAKEAQLRNRMAHLPQKWRQEQERRLRMEMGERIVQAVTEMVEGHNISHHLEAIEAAPLDFAAVPTIPRPPRLTLFAFLGGALGAFLCATFFCVKAVGSTPVEKERSREER